MTLIASSKLTQTILSDNENIVMLKSEGNYTRIHYNCGKETLSSYTLMRYEEVLRGFYRVNRKYLVNPRFIAGVDKAKAPGHVVLSNGYQVKIPRRKAKGFYLD